MNVLRPHSNTLKDVFLRKMNEKWLPGLCCLFVWDGGVRTLNPKLEDVAAEASWGERWVGN